MSPNTAIIVALVIPLFGALLIGLARRSPNVREGITLITAATLFLLVLSITPSVLAGARPSIKIFELLPGLAIAFEVEPLGMLFALIASFLWIPNSIYSIGYMRSHHESNQTR